MHLRTAFIFILTWITYGHAPAQAYHACNEVPPVVTREFRGAWVASIYNIDWPSRKGMSAADQQAELRKILDQMARLRMNAIIFQVRPHADALYRSRLEPWSPWLTGTMGKSPGYDPLAYCISQAHARGIEVHAWLNPYRALPNAAMPTSRNHITRTHPSVIKAFKSYKWMNPAHPTTQQRALAVILDVTRRYNIDGIHIDDYFYPYPDVHPNGQPKQIFPDGKSPSQRRAYVDHFVRNMYTEVKKIKPWVRVGISPFGIWKPGVPAGTTASINAYEHLAADSRKWLQRGWCDYLSPQLYWRIAGPQSYTKLLSWWRSQGRRPVWPGIATSRINSKADPGRPASEIINQVQLSRSIGKNWSGHVHWSMNALLQNQGGIKNQLAQKSYTSAALVPPMPWLSTQKPMTPVVRVKQNGSTISLSWKPVPGAAKYALQARYDKNWFTIQILPSSRTSTTIKGRPDAIALRAVDRYGTTSSANVLRK